jgi:hypothetical protein
MNSTTFLLLANSSAEVDRNQISFGTIDFQPHPPNLTPVFKSLDQEMDLMIGSLNFRIGSLGMICLSDPAKLDPSASKTKTIVMSESSVGSSSEVNSPVSFATAENIGEKIEELEETMENLGLGDQLEDFRICYDDALDKSTDTWKTGLELHEDNETIFSSSNSKFDNRYQVLAIVGDNSEEFDDNNNPVLNPANINRGANHLAEGDTAESLASREKIRLSVEEWNTIKAAVEHGMPIPIDASKNMLLGYHYALRQQSKQLARERSKIQKRKDSAIAASIALHKARSEHRIQTAKGTVGTDQELKTLNTQKGEASPKTSTHPSYRSTSKAISYQRHQKQRLWQHKRICTLRGQVQETQGNICTGQHCKD